MHHDEIVVCDRCTVRVKAAMYKVYGGLWNVSVNGEVLMCHVNMPAPEIMYN